MAEQVSSAGERETGGEQVTLACFEIDAAFARDPAVLRNPIPELKKDERKNPIAAQKKRRFGFYTRTLSKFRTLIARRNPSARRKSFPNTDGRGWRNTSGNIRKIDALVTTNHLFWPNERRKRAFLLPIWLPNPGFLDGKCNGLCREGGGGGQAVDAPKNAITDKLSQNFTLKGSPVLSVLWKKCAAPPASLQ
jgi:hypothetical protein